jgi:hypothetical protein
MRSLHADRVVYLSRYVAGETELASGARSPVIEERRGFDLSVISVDKVAKRWLLAVSFCWSDYIEGK